MKRRIGLSSLGGWVLNGHHVESAVTSSFSVNSVETLRGKLNASDNLNVKGDLEGYNLTNVSGFDSIVDGYKSSGFHYDPVSPLLAALTKRGDLNSAKSMLDDTMGYLRMFGMQALSDLKVSDLNQSEASDLTQIGSPIDSSDISFDDVSFEDPKMRVCVAIDGLTPVFEMVGVKVGGSIYQVPRPISLIRGRHKAVSWLVNAAYGQVQGSGRGFYRVGDARGNEILSVVEDLHLLHNSSKGDFTSGAAIKSVSLSKKLALYRLAKANRNYVSMLFGGQVMVSNTSESE